MQVTRESPSGRAPPAGRFKLLRQAAKAFAPAATRSRPASPSSREGRLLYLVFDATPDGAIFPPWLHAAAWHVAERGAVAGPSFVDLPHWSAREGDQTWPGDPAGDQVLPELPPQAPKRVCLLTKAAPPTTE
jgi:hypothetical protein